MDAEGLSRAVRQQVGMGRLLPLGDAADGAWLAETAAVTTLRTAGSRDLPDVRLGALRLSAADPGRAVAPVVTPPPSALPPGPLRVGAEFESTPHAPLTTMAELLRATLLTAADRELGLRVTTVDLRITDLLESGDGHNGHGSPGTSGARNPAGNGGGAGAGTGRRQEGRKRHPPGGGEHPPPAPADDPRGTATAQAVIAVPGVARLAPVLGPLGRLPTEAVDVTDTVDRDGCTAARHLLIQLAVAEGARALDVVRAVRRAAEKAAAWDAEEEALPVTVAVLVSAIDPAAGRSR
ncbi:hypothetical protein DB35_19525 [Streptomyces abyssalis]|uniref:Nucleopolyhedrovirus P10 family protein n=1 Tax=Streptomyces abyssalis TaxID=933944 RepID=A0A1E7JLI0_9ACTN|nr:hypothetical protein [Streptomyces abyssalis]OEU88475.1 hypothetical protein AN215_20655 [Streptomyces abyssalis]OEU89214.1 hypothetical protein DB35_19525 [Streptomyces abyssalis]